MSLPRSEEERHDLTALPDLDGVSSAFLEFAQAGQDLHIITRAEHADAYLSMPLGRRMRVANEWRIGDERLLVLSMEDADTSLATYLSRRKGS